MKQSDNDKRGAFDVLPADATPCIWMAAGVLAYRLCDRGLDCEHCPLDAALRGVQPPSEADDHPRAVPASLDFPEDRRYHRAHGWVLRLGEGRVRCGIDAFAARMLRHAREVILPAEGSHLRQGQVGWWLADGSALIPLRSPVSGSVTRRNEAVQRHDELVQRSPYDAGWLLELRCRPRRDEPDGLISSAEARRRALGQLRTFSRRVTRLLQRSPRPAGATLADGGERLTDLRRILGPRRYYAMVSRFLG